MKEAKIIILAGQSNAVGVGHVACLPKHFDDKTIEKWKKGYDKIQINYFSHDKKSDGFVNTSTGCTEVSKDTIGPELGIADTLDKKYPGEEFFIVKCAVGGTSLYRDWLPPECDGYDEGAFADQYEHMIRSLEAGMPIRASWCYNELVKILKESVIELEKRGCKPDVKAFCWMQGEADSCLPEHTAQYTRLYGRMLDGLCKAFPGMFDDCVYIDAGISTVWPLYKELNEEKKKFADEKENRVYLDTIAAGLTTENEPFGEPDTYHYDSDCVIKLGHMYADAVIKGLEK